MKQRLIVLLILIFFLVISRLPAQRPPCMPDWTLLSYEGKIPDRFPLLKLDMPYEAMLFYIWYSDWVYNYDVNEIDDIFNNKSFDDEYKEIIKRIYIAQDYNPILLERQNNYEDSLKKASQAYLTYRITERLRDIAPDTLSHYALIKSEVIVRFKITDIINRIVELGEAKLITSEVQDVIKGNFIPTCKDMTIPDSPEEYIRPEPSFQLNESGKCFQFDISSDHNQDIDLDVGNDFIIFIYFKSLCSDTLNNFYYTTSVTKQSPFSNPDVPRYFVFPVNNEIVDDPNRLFNFGDSLTYDEWREKLQEKIDEILNKNYTSVDEPHVVSNDISVYPNPAGDFFFIRTNDFGEYSLSITNTLGQEIIRRQFKNGNKTNRINVSDLTNGCYFITITSSSKIYTFPLIKQ